MTAADAKIVVFSGAHPADRLGATRAVDRGLVEAFARSEHPVLWLARGADAAEQVCSIDLDDPGRRRGVHSLARSLTAKMLHMLSRRQQGMLVLYSEYDERAALALSRLVATPDGVGVVIGRSGMSGRTFAVAKAAGAVTVVRSQWLHPIEHARLLGSALAQIGSSSAKIPESRLRRQLEELSGVDLIWCNSTLVLDSFRKHGTPEERLLYTPLGVDLAHYGVSPSELLGLYPRRKRDFRVLFVGSVNAEKGVHIFLQALLKARVSDFEVVLNGAVAPYFRSRLADLVRQLATKGIDVKVEPGDPRANYRRSSFLVLPSVHESFGLVVLEAMAAGLPVVVSDHVGAKDCVRDQRDGLHFRSGEVDELAGCIETLYADRDGLETFGRSARRAVERFSWDAVAERFLDELGRRPLTRLASVARHRQ